MADIPASVTTKAELEGGYSGFGSFSGQLEKLDDHDWIRVSLTAGQTYQFYASFLNTGSHTDGNSTLRLRDATGAQIAFADDGGVGENSLLSYPITTTGTYFIDVGEVAGNRTGDYSLYMTTPAPTLLDLLTDDNDIAATAFLNHTFVGGKGADTIQAGFDACTILGEQGNDILTGGQDNDHISGGLGHDTIDGDAGDDVLFGDAGDDDMSGGNDSDNLFGGAGDDTIDGGAGIDFLLGDSGGDNLSGGAGGDFLIGGSGKDFLTGGADGDVFVFISLSDSKRGVTRDVITDFVDAGDVISLSAIDAKTGGADNAFKFIGSHAFHHKAGELHYKIDAAHDRVIIQGDVNGDGKADFEIELSGLQQLQPGDFSL
jgi:Ca2+-binding RTX toxin-like protein